MSSSGANLSGTYGPGGTAGNIGEPQGDTRYITNYAITVNGMDPKWGIKADGVTDDSAAVQAMLNAAPPGARIKFGLNYFQKSARIHMLNGITTQADQIIELDGSHMGQYTAVDTVGSGPSGTTNIEFDFASLTGTVTAITLGPRSRLEHVTMRGPGSSSLTTAVVNSTSGVSGPSHNFYLNDVHAYQFGQGLNITTSFYAVLDNVEIALCGTAATFTNCNNVSWFRPRILCYSDTNDTVGGTGVVIVGSTDCVNFFGGSIEGYSVGIVPPNTGTNINIWGTYFETAPSAGDAYGIKPATTATKLNINIVGAYCNLNEHAAFVRFDATNSALTGKGNRFACSDSTTTHIAYECALGGTGNTVNLEDDNWNDCTTSTTAFYTDAAALGAVGHRIAMPTGYNGTAAFPSTRFDGKVVIPLSQAIAFAANGVLTIDASQGDAVVALSANVTGMTFNNKVIGQVWRITFVQDATGGRTYTGWPANVKFAGGVAPSDITANKQTTIQLRWDGTNWQELSRSVAVG